MHPRREFFELDPDQVIGILKLLNADVTEEAKSDVEAEISQEDREAPERVKRRPTLKFGELGLAAWSVLTFVRDKRVRVEVVDDRRVRLVDVPDGEFPAVVLDDEPKYVSPLSRDLLGVSNHVEPTPFWLVGDGRSRRSQRR